MAASYLDKLERDAQTLGLEYQAGDFRAMARTAAEVEIEAERLKEASFYPAYDRDRWFKFLGFVSTWKPSAELAKPLIPQLVELEMQRSQALGSAETYARLIQDRFAKNDLAGFKPGMLREYVDAKQKQMREGGQWEELYQTLLRQQGEHQQWADAMRDPSQAMGVVNGLLELGMSQHDEYYKKIQAAESAVEDVGRFVGFIQEALAPLRSADQAFLDAAHAAWEARTKDIWNEDPDGPLYQSPREWMPFTGESGAPPEWGRPTSSWRMHRLGATAEELAKEQLEEILGYEGKGGHKPPRADIAKMKRAHDLYWLGHGRALGYDETADTVRELIGNNEWERHLVDNGGVGGPTISPAVQQLAQEAFKEQYEPDERQQHIINLYLRYTGQGMDPQRAFDQLTYAMSRGEPGAPLYEESEDAAKKAVGQALKRYETANWPALYTGIKDSLHDLYRRSPDGSKLWPWAVKAMKQQFDSALAYSQQYRQLPDVRFPHLVDIAAEAGPVLADLKRQNKTPAGMDVNKMDLGEVEEWLMQWKAENRSAESKGHVVYEWPDGWTVEKLTTPEQLQHEGDEMGHCVGGYCNQVENGESAIYSLRDPKGGPHATLELTPIRAGRPLAEGEQSGDDGNIYLVPTLENEADLQHHRQLLNEGRQDLIDQLYPRKPHGAVHVTPDTYDPDAGLKTMEAYNDRTGMPLEAPTFEVVQVQGKEDHKPKPEYNERIKEWLNALRETKGVDFVRSPDWYGNADADDTDDELEYPDLGNAEDLNDWYERYDENRHKRYQGGEQDDFGVMNQRRSIQSLDLDKAMEQSMTSLLAHANYDRDTWATSDWTALARATYQAAVLGGFSGKQFGKALEQAQEQLDEWVQNHMDYAYGNHPQNEEGFYEKFEEIAKRNNEDISDVEEAADREHEEDPHVQYSLQLWRAADRLHPDTAQDARDEAQWAAEEAYAGPALKYLQYLNDLAGTGTPLREWPGGHNGYHEEWDRDKLPPPGELPPPGAFEQARMALPGALSANLWAEGPRAAQGPGWSPAAPHVPAPGHLGAFSVEGAPYWEPGMENPPGMPRPVYERSPVPWTTQTDPEMFEPYFKATEGGFGTAVGGGDFLFERGDNERMQEALEGGLCVLCGEPLGDPVWFFLDPRAHTAIDGGLHERCARMTAAHCPHMQAGGPVLSTAPRASWDRIAEAKAGDDTDETGLLLGRVGNEEDGWEEAPSVPWQRAPARTPAR